MGAIKDIVDLCIQLRNENRDGKISAALSEIQSLTLALQSEQAAIVEKNVQLVTDNLQLKQKLLELEASHLETIAALQQRHREEIARIASTHSRPKVDQLNEIETKMLVALANQPDHNPMTDEELIQRLGLAKAKGDYHFDQLRKRKFVATGGGQMGRGMFWFVTDSGRDYMAQAGLL